MMNKDAIKVVKLNKKDGEKNKQIVDIPTKVASSDQHEIINVVNSWISERRETSRVEKVFSDSNITSWKNMLKKFNESST